MSTVKKIIDQFDAQKGRNKQRPFILILLISITVLFLPFVIILLNAKADAHFTVPNKLSLSTLTLISSSWFIFKARGFKANDHYGQFIRSLGAILVLGIAFLCLQYFGWKVLLSSFRDQQKSIIAVIIIIHALHFILAIGFVCAILVRSYKINNAADFFLHFLKSNRNYFVENTFLYWEFLTFLWVALYFLMLLI
jgi:cytochrome c oxidase subunit 3